MRFPFPAPPGELPASTALTDSVAGQLPAEDPPEAAVPPSVRNATELLAPAHLAAEEVRRELPEFVREPITTAVEDMIRAEDAAKRVEEAAKSEPSAVQVELGRSPAVVPMPRPRLRRKVLAFPRHLMATPDVAYRLADPIVAEQPRILDVPEELEAVPTTPFLDGLQFDTRPAQRPPYAASDHPDLPLRPASLSRRLYAALLDTALVAAGLALFGGVAHKMSPSLSPNRLAPMSAALVLGVLWFVYQYLFLVYGGRTAGMRVARIRLLTFQGSVPTMRERRNRAVALVLSTASLAMGLLWIFVDVDGLCWHDRMSQTYLTIA